MRVGAITAARPHPDGFLTNGEPGRSDVTDKVRESTLPDALRANPDAALNTLANTPPLTALVSMDSKLAVLSRGTMSRLQGSNCVKIPTTVSIHLCRTRE